MPPSSRPPRRLVSSVAAALAAASVARAFRAPALASTLPQTRSSSGRPREEVVLSSTTTTPPSSKTKPRRAADKPTPEEIEASVVREIDETMLGDAALAALDDPPLTTLRRRKVKARKPPVLNGWVPDARAFCYGLPGATAPLGAFDPFGFSDRASLDEVRRYREAEVMHARVAMVASIGYPIGELASPVVWGGRVTGPANDHLDLVPGPLLGGLVVAVGVAETIRARRGWVEPEFDDDGDFLEMRATYYPGDLGFDPLGLKPATADGFAEMQTKELNNGRLAMLAASGMCVQELVTHKTIAETLDDLLAGRL